MKTFGIEKTTIRMIVTLPDNTAHIQRLYDYGGWFDLQKETISDNVDKVTSMVQNIKVRGGSIISESDYISDDDFRPRHQVIFELVT